MAASARLRPAPTADEAGTGLIGTLFGVTAFLLFLLLAVQVLLGLYTTTVVSAATVDAATEVARQPDPADVGRHDLAARRAVESLGSFGRDGRVTFDWTGTSDDEVVLTVHGSKPTFLPAAFGSALGNRIDRTVRIRVERLR